MNMLTVTEFFTFIVILVIVLLVLICWKTYWFEKKQSKAPSLAALGAKLDAVSVQTGNISSIQSKMAEISAKTDPIQNIQKALGELSGMADALTAKADKSASLTDSFAGLQQDMQIMLDALSERIDNLARQMEDAKTVQEKVYDLKTDTDQMKQQIEEIRTVHLKLLSDISAKVEKIEQNICSAAQKKTVPLPPAENADSKIPPEKGTKPACTPAPNILSGEALYAPQSSLMTKQTPAEEPAPQEPPSPKNSAQTEPMTGEPVPEILLPKQPDPPNSPENQEKAMSHTESEEERRKQELLTRI